jgi:hypothetical protein
VRQTVRFFGGGLPSSEISALDGISTDVDTFAETVRPSIFADVFEREMRPGKDPAGQALTFPNQPKEQVLGLNRMLPSWLAS